MFEGLSLLEFNDKFSTDENCYQQLSGIKWKNDYQCAKCGHRKYLSGKQPCSHCCSKCKLQNPLPPMDWFHKLKFPLRKAFYIVFLVVSCKKDISSYELRRKLKLRQKTCWLFKRKVMEAMGSSGKHLLKAKVEDD